MIDFSFSVFDEPLDYILCYVHDFFQIALFAQLDHFDFASRQNEKSHGSQRRAAAGAAGELLGIAVF